MKKLKFLTFCLFFLFNINVSVAELTKTQDTAVLGLEHEDPSLYRFGRWFKKLEMPLKDPTGGTFNKDGTKVFFTNNRVDHTDSVTVMRVSRPYDLRTASRVFEGGDPIKDIAGVQIRNDQSY